MGGKKPNVANCQFCECFSMEKTGFIRKKNTYYCGFSLGPKNGRLVIHRMNKCPKEEEIDASNCEM